MDGAGTLDALEGGDGSMEVGPTSHLLLGVHRPESPSEAETEAMAGQDSMRDESQELDDVASEPEAISITQFAPS
jgi:hypothetical protein